MIPADDQWVLLALEMPEEMQQGLTLLFDRRASDSWYAYIHIVSGGYVVTDVTARSSSRSRPIAKSINAFLRKLSPSGVQRGAMAILTAAARQGFEEEGWRVSVSEKCMRGEDVFLMVLDWPDPTCDRLISFWRPDGFKCQSICSVCGRLWGTDAARVVEACAEHPPATG